MSEGAPRAAEQAYRARWTWDGVSWGTHCVDCYPGNCPYRLYTRGGKVWREEPSGDFEPAAPGVPDKNPMGCNKGAAWSRQLDNADRLLHPLRRVGERGEGSWERISWDDALEVIADAIIDAVEAHGPESVMTEGTPEFSTVPSTFRFFNFLGGVLTDFNATTNDINVGLSITFGKWMIVSSMEDWFHSELVLVWHMNPAYTRIPHFHFVPEARYHGAEVVLIAPDYNPTARHADCFVSVEPGSDAALALAMCQVIVEEGIVDVDFVCSQTDLPLLVRLDTMRFLREADLLEGGGDEQFFRWVDGALEAAPRGTLLMEGARPELEGRYVVGLASGEQVEVTPAFALLRDMLDEQYRPEHVADRCGANPEVVRMLARKVSAKRTNVMFGASASKYYHGDLIERSICLLLGLTGNWGRKGTGIRSFDTIVDGLVPTLSKLHPGRAGGAELFGLFRDAVDELMQSDPTMTREIASTTLMRLFRAMTPPFFYYYEHLGYRDRWNRREWSDASMKRPFDDYLSEALDSGWWDGMDRQRGHAPHVLLEVGGNTFRRLRGGRRMLLENLWPNLDLAVAIDWRMSVTAMHSDVVLPAANHYEKVDFHAPTAHVMSLVFSDRSQEPAGEAREEWWIFANLARVIGERAAARGLDLYSDSQGVARRYGDLWRLMTYDGAIVDGEAVARDILDDSIEAGTVAEGTDLGVMRERGHVPLAGWGTLPWGQALAAPFPENETHTHFRYHVERGDPFPTVTRRAQFYVDHPWFLEAGEALPVHKDPPTMGGDFPLMLTSGHNRWSIHAMNIAHRDLLQTHRGVPLALLSRADAAAREICDGDEIELFNDAGRCRITAMVTATVRPGQVVVYNGWEPFQHAGWVGVNDLEAGMVKWTHLVTGYGQLNYFPKGWQPSMTDRATRLDARRAPAP